MNLIDVYMSNHALQITVDVSHDQTGPACTSL